MSKTAATLAAGLAALAYASSVRAHHTYLAYQTTAIWIHGAVTGVELKNPHTIITLEDRNQDGQVRLWAVEGPSQTAIDRMGVHEQVPKVGDAIQVCAFPYRPWEEIASDPRIVWGDDSARRSPPPIYNSSSQFVSGHVIVMPDGRMKLWGSGTISACMRGSDDTRPAWVDFLNANPKAREPWCKQREGAVQSNALLRDFVEAVNSSLYEPCK